MKKRSFEDLLETESLSVFRQVLIQYEDHLNASQAMALVRHVEKIDAPKTSIKFAFVHTYTSELLDPWLRLQAVAQGYSADIHHTPFGLNLMEATKGSDLAAFKPDITVMMFQQRDLHPDLKNPISSYGKDAQDSIATEAIENLVNLIGRFRSVLTGQILLSILPKIQSPDLGLYDLQAPLSETFWWARLRSRLAERLGNSIKASLLLDLDEMVAEFGRVSSIDLRLWYSARFPFTPVAARDFSRRIVSLGVSVKAPKAKVIALDADNTLWGGIIGEDGLTGIQLGPDYPGNTFLDFQHRLLGLQQRGFILVMCSKNNPEDVDEVLTKHPHQILKEEHFAARRVNWKTKTQNLTSIAEELNLGLESFIFVDDSNYECELVRQELPQIEVIQMPEKPIKVPFVLDKIARLEIMALTDEDRDKTVLYNQERQRKELQEQYSEENYDIDDYLRSLEMTLTIEVDKSANLARLAQLSQKTNQFNLTTRRYTEEVIADWISRNDWIVASFSLADRFGHSGVVGLAIFEFCSTDEVKIDTFLMSCRTIGRKAETAFLETLIGHLQDKGCKYMVGEYIPTPKNKLVEKFLHDHQFELDEHGHHRRDLTKAPAVSLIDFPMKVIITNE